MNHDLDWAIRLVRLILLKTEVEFRMIMQCIQTLIDAKLGRRNPADALEEVLHTLLQHGEGGGSSGHANSQEVFNMDSILHCATAVEAMTAWAHAHGGEVYLPELAKAIVAIRLGAATDPKNVVSARHTYARQHPELWEKIGPNRFRLKVSS